MPILEHTYEVIGQTVKICLPGEKPVHLDKPTLKAVIDNIHRTRMFYATEEAFQRALNLYEGALRLLENQS